MVIRALRVPLEYPLQPTKPSVDDGVISTGICIWKRLFIRLQIIDTFIRMDFLELKLCTNDKNSLFQKDIYLSFAFGNTKVAISFDLG